MNTPDPLDALLDAKLREETAYIDDGGFTRRVMQQLTRQQVPLATQRSIIIFAAAVLSAVVAYFASGEGVFVRQALAHIVSFTPLQNLLVVAGMGLFTTIAALWAALRARDSVV